MRLAIPEYGLATSLLLARRRVVLGRSAALDVNELLPWRQLPYSLRLSNELIGRANIPCGSCEGLPDPRCVGAEGGLRVCCE